MDTARIKKTIEDNKDGVTVNPLTGDKVLLSSGFAVAVTDNKIKTVSNRFINRLLSNISLLNSKNAYIGSWFCNDDNNYYVDISLVVDDLDTAMALGRVFRQKAIFDFSTMQSLNL